MTDPERAQHAARDVASRDGTAPETPAPRKTPPRVKEIGGPAGPEPTRYGDWERKGIASDF